MNKLGLFKAENAQAFGSFEIDLGAPGLNLIIGKNLDDARGNDSRNAAGKSSILKILEYHLFGTASGLSGADIVPESNPKNYSSELTWKPHGQEVHHSYQYQKHINYGNDLYLYSGGSYDEYEAGQEGVVDVSWDAKLDSQRYVSAQLGYTYDEWVLLASLLDVTNDAANPFFTNRNQAGRLELIQNLFGMTYSKINEENNEHLKEVKRQISSCSIQVASQIELIEKQLAEIPDQASLDIVIATSAQEITKLEKRSSLSGNQIDQFEGNQRLIARYSHLHTQLEQAGALTRDVPAEKVQAETNLAQSQQHLSLLVQATNSSGVLKDKLQSVTDFKLRLSSYSLAGDEDETSLRATQNELYAKWNIYVQASVVGQDGAIKEGPFRNLPELASLASGVRATLEQEELTLNASIVAIDSAVANLEPTIKLELEQRADHAAWSAIQVQVDAAGLTDLAAQFKAAGQAALHTALLESRSTVNNTASHLQGLSKQVADITSSLTDANCPTCGQEWVKHTNEDRADLEVKLAEVNVQVQQYTEALAQWKAYVATLEKLNGLAVAAYWKPIVDSDSQQDVEVMQAKVAELKSQRPPLAGRVADVKRLLQIHGDLEVLTLDPAALQAELAAVTTKVNSVSAAMVVKRDLEAAEVQLAEAQANLNALLVQINMAEEAIPDQVKLYQDSVAQNQQFINWANQVLPILSEYKSEAFAEIEKMRQSVTGVDIESLRKAKSDVDLKLTEARSANSEAMGYSSNRTRLNASMETVKKEALQLESLQSQLRIRSAVALLSGAKGLIVQRTKQLFERINHCMNQNLGMLIQDGLNSGKPLTAWLEMSNRTVDLNVYKGDTLKSLKSLSKSENARTKLALTLALRELAPPNKLPNLLILDEVDGSSCDTNTDRIWECIRSYVARYPSTSVWAVSHSQAVQQSGIWDSINWVIKQEGIASLVSEKVERNMSMAG